MFPGLPGLKEKSGAAMIRGFAVYAVICRFGGCFFIQNFRKKSPEEMKIVWKSPYIIYSALCIASLAVFESVFVIGSVISFSDLNRSFTQSLLHILYSVVIITVIVNFLSVSFGSKKLLAFFRKSASFETATCFKPCGYVRSAEERWSLLRKVLLQIVLGISCFSGLFFIVSGAGVRQPKCRWAIQAHAALCGMLIFL